jgi:hypothetical protein
MILAKIDDEGMLFAVSNAPLIAFQRRDYGYAVATQSEAYYAPITHPGGGNLLEGGGTFVDALGRAFLTRMSSPGYRTLRPTAVPIITGALGHYLDSAFGATPEVMGHYRKAAGDHPAVVDYETQVVIQAIEEHARPDLKEAMRPGKRDMMSDCLDIVIQHAESARELCEVGEDKPQLIKMYILQASTAMKTALEMLLSP